MNMDAFESGAYWATEYKQLPKRLALVAVMLFKARGLNVASRLDAFDRSRQSAMCSDRELGVDGFTPDPIWLEITTGERRGEVRKKFSPSAMTARKKGREKQFCITAVAYHGGATTSTSEQLHTMLLGDFMMDVRVCKCTGAWRERGLASLTGWRR